MMYRVFITGGMMENAAPLPVLDVVSDTLPFWEPPDCTTQLFDPAVDTVVFDSIVIGCVWAGSSVVVSVTVLAPPVPPDVVLPRRMILVASVVPFRLGLFCPYMGDDALEIAVPSHSSQLADSAGTPVMFPNHGTTPPTGTAPGAK
jgi:hypothetical protein